MNAPQIQRIIFNRHHVWVKPSIVEEIARLALQQEQKKPMGNLVEYRDCLGTYAYNALRRGGFTSIEEVAAATDAQLLKVRQIGHGVLAKIRSIAP